MRFKRAYSAFSGRPALGSATGRWLLALVVLIGALAVTAVQRWSADSQSPIAGRAFVIDGDTLTIEGTRIRLVDVDAPELDQHCTDGDHKSWPCGRAAANELQALIRSQLLTCRRRGIDQYHRVLAVCRLPDNTDINGWLVQNGWALLYGSNGNYRREQDEAKANRHGIWSGTFISPRQWRDQHPRSDG